MSYTRQGIFCAVAIAASFGAAQFAFGEGLTASVGNAVKSTEQGINRSTKADRAALTADKPARTQTIAIHVDRLPGTSLLVRIPRAQEARSLAPAAPAPLQLRSDRKPVVACEPMVSVLTEIAKQLQPGRCVT